MSGYCWAGRALALGALLFTGGATSVEHVPPAERVTVRTDGEPFTLRYGEFSVSRDGLVVAFVLAGVVVGLPGETNAFFIIDRADGETGSPWSACDTASLAASGVSGDVIPNVGPFLRAARRAEVVLDTGAALRATNIISDAGSSATRAATGSRAPVLARETVREILGGNRRFTNAERLAALASGLDRRGRADALRLFRAQNGGRISRRGGDGTRANGMLRTLGARGAPRACALATLG